MAVVYLSPLSGLLPIRKSRIHCQFSGRYLTTAMLQLLGSLGLSHASPEAVGGGSVSFCY